MMQIRQATINDVAVLLPLIEGYWAFERIPGFDSNRVAIELTRLLSNPRLGGGWIALENGAAVGYLLAVYGFSLEQLGLVAEIDEFFVVSEQRGQGVGRGLLEAAEAEFVRAGCKNVSLQLSRSNGSGRAFYHSHGYSERSVYEILDKTLSCD